MHFLSRHHGLAVKMSAALGKQLILNMEAGRARAFIGTNGARNVGYSAEASLAVGDDGHRHCVGDALYLADQLVQCDETDVGPAQEGICGAATGDVDHGKAGVLDQAGGETVAAAGDDSGATIGEKLAKLCSAFDDDFPLL